MALEEKLQRAESGPKRTMHRGSGLLAEKVIWFNLGALPSASSGHHKASMQNFIFYSNGPVPPLLPFLSTWCDDEIHLFYHYILGVTGEDILLFHRLQSFSPGWWHVGPDSSRVGVVLACVLYNFSSIPGLYPQHASSILLPRCHNWDFLELA